ncbi:hypothetical protein N473_22650 [Pseudoalteromonas luteoviolacea CPMOR-1]|uniref:Uncharacterized protein n=1 Tax=Pseudoalteromonas luteoviolacea CPMOR-1 TaxID=1365248 RepID=A0A167JID7_9GAMM|nr:hypothetical protein [Pseudoalteromonas luteoviolacea]KZN61145.1 hypothetical protein N473_22650 [Pseudoalteromonas luteoviolacea CPMOR-1]
MDNICHTAYRSGEVGYAIGAEYRQTQITYEMDAQSNAGLENGNVVSSFGGDMIGERDYKAHISR